MSRAGWIALGCLLVACGAEPRTLVIAVRTDMVPGVEFGAVRVELASEERVERRDARPGEDWTAYRLAEFDGLRVDPALATVTLELSGGRVLSRQLTIDLSEATTAVTVVFTRSCRGVDCPSTEQPSCLGGRCVAADCLTGTETQCGEPQCETAADCDESSLSCRQTDCVTGTCLTSDMCSGGQYCAPTGTCELAAEGVVVTAEELEAIWSAMRADCLDLAGDEIGEPVALIEMDTRVRVRGAIDLGILDPATDVWAGETYAAVEFDIQACENQDPASCSGEAEPDGDFNSAALLVRGGTVVEGALRLPLDLTEADIDLLDVESGGAFACNYLGVGDADLATAPNLEVVVRALKASLVALSP